MVRRQSLLALSLVLAGCGAGTAPARHPAPSRRAVARPVPGHRARIGQRLALVTAETRNQLIVIDTHSARVVRRIAMPVDPENVAVGDSIVVVSARAGAVTLLAPRTWRVRTTFTGFLSPHIVAIAPGGHFAYVSDDAAGTVTPIDLRAARRLPSVTVGPGAHHLTFSPNGRRLWIALGETARTLVLLDTRHIERPRVLRRLSPSYAVHDIRFSPDGRTLWLSAARLPDVTVLDAATLRTRFRIPVGAPPQHIAFAGERAYLTSGYGALIESADMSTGRIISRAATASGSFELDAGPGQVLTSSLFTGTVTMLNSGLRRKWSVTLAPATRDLALAGG